MMSYSEFRFFRASFLLLCGFFLAIMLSGHVLNTLDDQHATKRVALVVPAPKAGSMIPTQVLTTSRRMQVEEKLIEHYKLDEAKARKLAPIYLQAARESSISTDILLAVTWAETRFRDHLVSEAGAVGMMQVMPTYWVGEIDFVKTRDDLFDVNKNIRAGARILAQCAERFGLDSAFKCYHGGAGGIYRPKKTTLQYTELVTSTLKRTHAEAI